MFTTLINSILFRLKIFNLFVLYKVNIEHFPIAYMLCTAHITVKTHLTINHISYKFTSLGLFLRKYSLKCVNFCTFKHSGWYS